MSYLARRGRRAQLLLFAAFLAVAGVLGLTGPVGAAAAGDSGAAPLRVDAGYEGFHVLGRAVPVRVTVTAERLLEGDLVARVDGQSAEVEMPVEIPGGSVKRFALVLPPTQSPDELGVVVELRDGKRVLARGEKKLRSAQGQELVGLLPGVLNGRSLPGPAAMTVDVGLARFVAVDATVLSLGTAGLDALSAIGAGPEELGALSPSARSALLGWVADGGRLLVDAAPGGSVTGLPPEWQPGTRTRIAAGFGEIRLTGDAMAAGRWAGLVEPTPRGRSTESPFFGDGVSQSIARDAGLHLPRLSTLLAFLGLYVLAVGPVTAIVLRRKRRPELAWVLVPALAVVFTGVAYVAGGRNHDSTRIGHGTVVEFAGGRAAATTYVGLTRPGGGTAEVGFPSGWTVRSSPSSGWFGDARFAGMKSSAPGDTPGVQVTPDGPQAELPLAVGQFGVVTGSGPVSLPGALEVTAGADAKEARGTVRNRLPFSLDEVRVLIGLNTFTIGHLGPGEEREWRLADDSVAVGDWSNFPWSPEGFPGSDRPDEIVNLPLWQASRMDAGPDGEAGGVVTAVGWTKSYHPPVRLDGHRRTVDGRTAVIARAPITAAAGTAPALAVRRELVRGPGTMAFGWRGDVGDPSQATVLRFTLPEGAEGKPLVLKGNAALQSVAVWSDRGWQFLSGPPVGPNGLAIQDPKSSFLPVPPRAVIVPAMPVTTTGPPPPPPVIIDGTAPDVGVPAPFPGKRFFVGPGGGIDASGGIAVPAHAVRDGVVFVQVQWMNFGDPNSVLTLGEAS